MRIAIASLGETETSEISTVAGRSPYYIIFDDNKLIEAIKNPFIVGGGAGYGVTQLLNDNNVDKVIAGKYGGNMEEALKENGIDFTTRSGIVKNAL